MDEKNLIFGSRSLIDQFWSPGYFITTTENVSIDTLKQYIEKQSRKLLNEDES